MRKDLDGLVVVTMVVLCATWGSQQVAIKLAAHDIAPMVQMATRSAISAALVLLFMLLRGQRLSLLGPTLWPGLLAGVLFAGEFLFVAEGLRRTSASHMAVLLYTSPIFTAVGLHWLIPSERLRLRHWAGILLACVGVAVAFASGLLGPRESTSVLTGDALGLLAGASWGATTVVIRGSALSQAPPARVLLYQLVVAAFLLLGIALGVGQLEHVTLTPLACSIILYQGVVVSFASYLAWLWVLRRYFVAKVAVLPLMTPLFGVMFGALVLKERIDPTFAAGAILVFTGIAIVALPPRRPPASAHPPESSELARPHARLTPEEDWPASPTPPAASSPWLQDIILGR